MAALRSIFTRCAAPNQSIHRVELWLTPCIVTHPPGGWCDTLVVPGNESLVGTALPYFPVGGPVPKAMPTDLANSAWGGMNAGTGMLYPSQVVDGVVSLHGGKDLHALRQALPVVDNETGARCPVGQAVTTPTTGTLKKYFASLVHTVPPFRSSNAQWAPLLTSCYHRALDLSVLDIDLMADQRTTSTWDSIKSTVAGYTGVIASSSRLNAEKSTASKGDSASAKSNRRPITVAFPLLGAGARGASAFEAAAVGAAAVTSWADADTAEASAFTLGEASSTASKSSTMLVTQRRPLTIRFGCTDQSVTDVLESSFQEQGWTLTRQQEILN